MKIRGDCFGRRPPEEKYRGPKLSPTNSHKNRWCKVIIVTATLTIWCVLCVFFDKNTKKTALFIISVLIPVNEFRSVQIIARCDKCANTGCIARDCLCVYAYARMALAIIPMSHAEIIIRSHCYVIMTAQFFAPNWQQSTWIGSRYYAGY